MARKAHFRERQTAAQQRIRQAALRLFAEKGIDNVNVKELALSARVARGTLYNNRQSSIKDVFEDIASQLSAEMHERVYKTFADVDDPLKRMAGGMRLFVRRAYEEPEWGAFVVRFALSDDALRQMWLGHPRKDIAASIAAGGCTLRAEQMSAAIMMLTGSTLGAMFLVLHGHRGWRAAGSDAAELVLRAFGVAPQKARAMATGDLPALARID